MTFADLHFLMIWTWPSVRWDFGAPSRLQLPDEYSGLQRLFTAIIGQPLLGLPLGGKTWRVADYFSLCVKEALSFLSRLTKDEILLAKLLLLPRSSGWDGLQVDQTPTALHHHHHHPQLPNCPGKQERAGSVLGCFVQTGGTDGIMTFTNSILMRGGEKERYVKCTKASISTSGSASGTN